jgi:hypothetical protein
VEVDRVEVLSNPAIGRLPATSTGAGRLRQRGDELCGCTRSGRITAAYHGLPRVVDGWSGSTLRFRKT